MKLSISLVVFALLSSAVCAPDRLRHPSKNRLGGMTSGGLTSHSNGVESYEDTALHESSGYRSLYSKRINDPGSSAQGGKVVLGSSDDRVHSGRSTRRPRHRNSSELGSSSFWTRRHSSIRREHETYVKSGTATSEANSRLKTATKVTGTKRETPKDSSPTPAPTGAASTLTTVHITDDNEFALLLPKKPNEPISDAESDGIAFCTTGCENIFQQGFITAASVTRAPDNSSWIQVTGCLDSSKFQFAKDDAGGQFDVRFPNGAQCAFGGYGASFIEQVEPSSNRFCLRCCSSANDQANCNSHQDRAGCPVAIPGVYDFPDKGVSCS